MNINTFESQLRTMNDLRKATLSNQSSMEKLASGRQINKAADNAAGLSISTRFQTQIRGTEKSIQNIKDAISLAQTADGSLGSIEDQLQRIRELAIQSKNGTNSVNDLNSIQNEITELSNAIDQTVKKTTFNGISILNTDIGMTFDGSTSKVIADLGDKWKASDGTAAQSIWSVETTFKINDWDPSPYTHPFSIGSNHDLTFYVATASKTLNFKSYFGANRVEFPIQTNMQLNTEYHVSATYDGTNVRVYLNGVLKATRPATGEVSVGDGKVIIGDAYANSSQNAWNGIVKDVRVYDQTLSSDEILKNYDGNIKRTGLLGEWLLNEGQQSEIKDTSGNDNNGKTIGQTSWKGDINIHTGSDFNESESMSLSRLSLRDLGINKLEVGDEEIIQKVDHALDVVINERAKYGTEINKLNNKIDYLSSYDENMSAASSRITDTDMANETSKVMRNKIVINSAISLLVQENQSKESLLQLLN